MRPTLVTAVIALFVVFAAQAVWADTPQPPRAATAQLPPALRAVGADPGQILDQRAAEAVRGQWWLNMPLKYGTLYFKGVGTFSVVVWTESQTLPNTSVAFRLTIGR